ncbi:MAG: pentapeptide repeat-containing protein [Kofleriaceae bacterium]
MLAGHFNVTCPRCAEAHVIAFYKLPGFDSNPFQPDHIGGVDPSQIISPHEFAAELARCSRDLRTDLPAMTQADIDVHGDLLDRGVICANELLKFLPSPATTEIPEDAFRTDEARAYRAAHRAQLTRAHLEERRDFFVRIGEQMRAEDQRRVAAAPPAPPRPPVLPPFSLASLKFHEQWLRDGEASGGQRLVARGVDVRERILARRDLSRASLDKVTLDRADLTQTGLVEAELTHVSLREAALIHTTLDGATLTSCTLAGARLFANLIGTRFDDCDFTGADLSGSQWSNVRISQSAFTSANLAGIVLSDTTFAGCDLRGVALGGPGTTWTGVRFVACDLRDTDWSGLALAGVQLIDCKLAGISGAPSAIDVAIEHPDLSPAGNGLDLGEPADVLRRWR